MRCLLLFLACMTFSGIANAQAFGVQQGASVDQYAGKSNATPYQFTIKVPQPNRAFEFYTAVATPQTGTCSVTGYGKTHKNDDYGTATKAEFAGLKQALNARYGPSKDYNFLHAGAIWTKPREWVWSFYKEERSLSSFWRPEHGSRLPSSLSGLFMSTRAIDTSGTYVIVRYEFANFDRCASIIDEQDNQGL